VVSIMVHLRRLAMKLTTEGMSAPLQVALQLNIGSMTPHGWELSPSPTEGYDLWIIALTQVEANEAIANLTAIVAAAGNIVPLNRIGVKGYMEFSVAVAKLQAACPDSTQQVDGVFDRFLDFERAT